MSVLIIPKLFFLFIASVFVVFEFYGLAVWFLGCSIILFNESDK